MAHAQDERPDETSARDWLSCLDEVRARRDRRASLPLLSLLLAGGLDEDERHAVAASLAALEDARCIPDLERVVLDPTTDVSIRLPALGVLSATPRAAPARALREVWARSDDSLIRAYALEFADVLDSDQILRAVGDPEPIVRRCAVEALATITRTPPLVRAAEQALVDSDPVVRELACRVALLDEPLALGRGLLRLVHDPDSEVRDAALDALEDYPQVAVMLSLADARGKQEEDEEDLAENVLRSVVREVARVYTLAAPSARARLARWLGPALWLVEEVVDLGTISPADALPARCPWSDDEDDVRAWEELVAENRGVVPPIDAMVARDHRERRAATEDCDVERARALLRNPASSPIEVRHALAEQRWAHTGDAGLAVLREFAASDEWAVRMTSVYAFADMDARDDLLRLAYDPEPVVVRCALANLRVLGEARAVEPSLAALADPELRPTAGDEALQIVATFADLAVTQCTLLDELTRPDDRDGLLLGAVSLVRELRMRKVLPNVLAVVAAPLVAAVRVHVAALQTLRAMGHRPEQIHLGHLEDIDHLHLQAELGEWEWRGGRYAAR